MLNSDELCRQSLLERNESIKSGIENKYPRGARAGLESSNYEQARIAVMNCFDMHAPFISKQADSLRMRSMNFARRKNGRISVASASSSSSLAKTPSERASEAPWSAPGPYN